MADLVLLPPAPELLRWATLLEFGLDRDGRLAPAAWAEPADLPTLFVGRYEGGAVVHPSVSLPAEALARLTAAPPERLWDRPTVEGLVRPWRVTSRRELDHGWVPDAPSPLTARVARHGSHFVALSDGRPVSWAWTVREHARAAVAGVETVPGFRRQGYASGVLAAWACAVREDGRLPLVAHDPEDVGARALCRRLGVHRFAQSVRYFTEVGGPLEGPGRSEAR